MKVCAVFLSLSCFVACGGSPAAPASPTPPTPPPPTPSLVALTGTISATPGGGTVSGATVRISDGPNQGQTTATSASGGYRFDGLTQGNANVFASATGFQESGGGVFINGSNTLNLTLTRNLWSHSGTGDNVFDMPLYVARVRVIGRYTAFSSNFIVRVAGRLLVNELLGTGWNQTVYDGTLLTGGGGLVAITNSSGVQWSFAEVR